MDMSFCTKCGNPLNSEDIFCSKCGCAVSVQKGEAVSGNTMTASVETGSQENETTGTPDKNKGIRYLLISFAIFAISLFGVFLFSGTLMAFMARLVALSVVLIFISGIMCIRFSHNCYKHKGRATGITSVVLSGLVILVVVVSLLSTWSPHKKALAVDCASELQSMLKDPTSMLIRSNIIVTDADDEDVSYVIIQYSAANSYGGMAANVAFFSSDIGYLGDYEADMSEMSPTQKRQYADAKLYYELGNIVGGFDAGSIISGKSIAKAIGCNYSDN